MKHVPNAVTQVVGRAILRTKKNSPTLLFVAGIGGAIGATVLACRATLKVETIVNRTHKDLVDAEVLRSRSQTTDLEYNAAKRHVILVGIYDLTKLYGPALGVGVVSIAFLTTSHRQLTQRNAALTAAYVSLQTFLEGYRGRVREALGEEKERDVYYSSTPVELVQDTKNGPKKIYGSAPGGPSPYSVIFDERNLNWQEAAEYNIHFVRIQEKHLTDKLRAQGYLFLNDAYKRLGIEPTQTGQVCGWFIGHEDSDDFVEIRIARMHDFHGTLQLDFNTAGNVLAMLDKRQKR